MTATALAAVGSNANENGTLLISGTAVTASGTSVDFTGIPSWAKRVTVMFSGVSTNGSSPPLIQIGTSGGVQTSGYLSSSSGVTNTSVASFIYTSGIVVGVSTGFWASNVTVSGAVVFSLLDSSNGTWAAQGMVSRSDSTATTYLASGAKTLSGTLDRVRVTAFNGTDAFDAGTINIMWE
jgi:hypothetical protein